MIWSVGKPEEMPEKVMPPMRSPMTSPFERNLYEV